MITTAVSFLSKDRGSSDGASSAAYAGLNTAYEESRMEVMDIVFMLFDERMITMWSFVYDL